MLKATNTHFLTELFFGLFPQFPYQKMGEKSRQFTVFMLMLAITLPAVHIWSQNTSTEGASYYLRSHWLYTLAFQFNRLSPNELKVQVVYCIRCQ